MRRWLAVLLVAAACGGDGAQEAATSTATVTTEVLGAAETVVAESAVDALDVFASADDDVPAMTLARDDEVSGRIVLVVRGDVDGDRLHVDLPVRPNGSMGWVRRQDVSLSTHAFSIEVRLGDHRIVVRDGDDVVLDAPIGVGTADTPTPGGRYYVKELLRPPDPSGLYGPYAYGLSGFSEAVDGVIGIHGTNDPDVIGTDVSLGCIRLRNEDITRLVEDIGLPLGTPVSIEP